MGYSKKLIIFGPSTLIKGEMGGFKDILISLGKKKEVQKIDREYQKRKFKGPWGLEKLTRLYRGFSQEKLKQISLDYCRENLIKEARVLMEEFKRKGFLIGAISANPQFLMDILKEILPLDFSEGTKLEFKDGVATGRIQRKVDRYIKSEILKRKRKKYKLKEEEVIVIGDFVTDLPMAKEAKVFIGFDAKRENADNFYTMIMTCGQFKDIF